MKTRRIFATLALLLWLALVALAFGLGRWGLGPGYAMLIDGATDALPLLTSSLSLPVLGIGPASASATLVSVGFWAYAWLPPILMLAAVWRARQRETLVELLVYGGAIYLAGLMLLVSLAVLGLFLPFMPLC